MTYRLTEVRARYAEEIGALAGVSYRPIVDALAAVPRERFLGPGPWTFPSEGTTSHDPALLYRNVLVALDASKGLNNGEPALWASLFERIRPGPGERIVHAGAGTGYYTALLAEMIGPSGHLTGIEFEPQLAEQAARNLAEWPNVEILTGDALQLARGSADVIVASAGFDAVPVAWARMLNDGGRLLVPLTAPSRLKEIGVGANLLATRRGDRFEAKFVGPVGIYHSMSGRSEEAGRRLAKAFRFKESADAPGGWRPPEFDNGSLRLEGTPDDTCWLQGEGWWISSSPPL